MNNPIRLQGESQEQLIFERLLDVLERLEFENLDRQLKMTELEKKIATMTDEKIRLAREVEHLSHRLSQQTKTSKEKCP